MVVGGDEAFVTDPRRDCEACLAIANQYGARTARTLGNRRNEDYVTGLRRLAQRTGDAIYRLA